MAVIAFGAIFAILSDLGLSPYLVREVARLRDVPDGNRQTIELYSNIIELRLVLSLVTVLLIVTVAVITNRPWLMVGAIALNSLGLFLYSFQGTSDAVLSGMERLDLSAGGKVLNQLTFILVGAGALLLKTGVYGLVIAGLAGVLVLSWYSWRCLRSKGIFPRRTYRMQWGKLLQRSLPFGLIGFALGLSYKFDPVLLDISRSSAETGYYNAAYNLIFSAVIISNILNTALYPSLSRQAIQDPQSLPRIYERILRILFMASLPISVGVWALADPIVRFLYTGAYLATIPALKVIIWVLPLMFASEFLGYVVIISNQERIAARAVLVSTGVNIAMNIILIPRFGYQAAAWMTVLTEAVLVGQYLWLSRPFIHRIDWDKALMRPCLAAGLMGAFVFLVRNQLPLPGVILVGFLFYLVLLPILGLIRKEDLQLILRHHPVPDLKG